MEERLQKIMAQAGLGSRRSCEELIAAGRVTVNGAVAGLGDKADPRRDRILVDGQPLGLPEELVYIAIYKPRGVISAVSSPDLRQTVRDLVDLEGHFYPVGRLDIESEGLMLLTNDGDLANRLTHPRYGHEKEYRVLVARRPDEEQLSIWRRGVVLPDGYRTAPADVQLDQPSGKGMWLRLVLKEGRKRQIRETGATLGLPVVKILRVRIGSLSLGNLKPRQWRYLTSEEVAGLKQGRKPSRPPKRPPASSTRRPPPKSPYPPSKADRASKPGPSPRLSKTSSPKKRPSPRRPQKAPRKSG